MNEKKLGKRKRDYTHIFLYLLFLFGILTQASQASSLTSVSTYTNPDGLILYYDMAQCTSTSATDRGDWLNTGTLTNTPTWVAGKYGCGINFATGGNSYIDASNNSILNPSAITISIWVYRTGDDSGVATYTIISKNNGGATPYYGIGLYGATNLYATANSNPVLSYGTEASVIPKNTWVYLAMTEDGSTLKTYVNGLLYNSSASSMTVTSITNLWIGGGSSAFQGRIDEPKIWNRALSAEEVYVDYLGTYQLIEQYYANSTASASVNTSMLNGFYNFTIFNQSTNNTLNNLANNLSIFNTSTNNTLNSLALNLTGINQTLINTLTDLGVNVSSLANLTANDVWLNDINRTTNCTNCEVNITVNNTYETNNYDNTITNNYSYNYTENYTLVLNETNSNNTFNYTNNNYYDNSTNSTINNSYYQTYNLSPEVQQQLARGIARVLPTYEEQYQAVMHPILFGYTLPMPYLEIGILAVFFITCSALGVWVGFKLTKRWGIGSRFK